MSRSGYNDDDDDDYLALARYRGQVASAIRGKRGQALLREMLTALDALPDKKLIAHELKCEDGVCALGSVGVHRGIDLDEVDPDDYENLAGIFNVADQLIREIEWVNDEAGAWRETPEHRWERVRLWVERQLKAPA